MNDLLGVTIGIAIVGVLIYHWAVLLRRRNQERYLRRFPFSPSVYREMKRGYPTLSRKEFDLVCHALRQYFSVLHESGFRPMGLPSRVVADLWKVFSEDIATYDRFCKKAFGRPVPPRPVSPFPQKDSPEEEALARTWRYCCEQEGIDRHQPSRLPLLFAIDTKLGIPGAIEYRLEKPPRPDGNGGYLGGSESLGPYYVSDFFHGEAHGSADFGSSGDFGSSDAGGGDFGGGDSGGGGGD